jgi:hypothetical protein
MWKSPRHNTHYKFIKSSANISKFHNDESKPYIALGLVLHMKSKNLQGHSIYQSLFKSFLSAEPAAI